MQSTSLVHYFAKYIVYVEGRTAGSLLFRQIFSNRSLTSRTPAKNGSQNGVQNDFFAPNTGRRCRASPTKNALLTHSQDLLLECWTNILGRRKCSGSGLSPRMIAVYLNFLPKTPKSKWTPNGVHSALRLLFFFCGVPTQRICWGTYARGHEPGRVETISPNPSSQELTLIIKAFYVKRELRPSPPRPKTDQIRGSATRW